MILLILHPCPKYVKPLPLVVKFLWKENFSSCGVHWETGWPLGERILTNPLQYDMILLAVSPKPRNILAGGFLLVRVAPPRGNWKYTKRYTRGYSSRRANLAGEAVNGSLNTNPTAQQNGGPDITGNLLWY